MGDSKPKSRLALLLLMFLGIGFIIAGAVILVLNAAAGGKMLVFGSSILTLGFGGLAMGFILYRVASGSSKKRLSDSGEGD